MFVDVEFDDFRNEHFLFPLFLVVRLEEAEERLLALILTFLAILFIIEPTDQACRKSIDHLYKIRVLLIS